MESFLISLRVVLPLCIWMTVGYTTRNILKLDEDWLQRANGMVFRVFLPLLLFKNMIESNMKEHLNADTAAYAIYAIASVTVVFVVMMLVVPRFEKDDTRKGVIVQGIFRTNTALYGLPVAISLYGEGNIGVAALLVIMVIPFYNVYAVIALEAFRGGKPNWTDILKKIATNPLIIALMLGLAFYFSGITLPSGIQRGIYGFAECATPFAFLCMGAGFVFSSAVNNRKTLAVVVLLRLVVVPILGILGAYLLGARGAALAGFMLIFASPTASSSYSMACVMGGDSRLANEIVVFTSALSVITVFLWVYALASLGLL